MTDNVTKRERHPSKRNHVTFNDVNVTSTDLAKRHSHPLRLEKNNSSAKETNLEKRRSYPTKLGSSSLLESGHKIHSETRKHNNHGNDSCLIKTVLKDSNQDATTCGINKRSDSSVINTVLKSSNQDETDGPTNKRNGSSVINTVSLHPNQDAMESDRNKRQSPPNVQDATESDRNKRLSPPTDQDSTSSPEWPYLTSRERVLSLQESQWHPLWSGRQEVRFHEKTVATSNRHHPYPETKDPDRNRGPCPEKNNHERKRSVATLGLAGQISSSLSYHHTDITGVKRDITGITGVNTGITGVNTGVKTGVKRDITGVKTGVTGVKMGVAKLDPSQFIPKRKTSKDSDHSSTCSSKKHPETSLELTPVNRLTSSDATSFKDGRAGGEQTLYVTANTFTSFYRPSGFKNINPCLITIFLVVVVAAVIGVTIYITNILHDKDLSPERANQRTIPVVKAILFIKIVNKESLTELREEQTRNNNTHPLIPAINDIFLRSELSQSFYGARILDNEEEDIKTELIFIDTGQITDADVIRRVIEDGGQVLAGVDGDILRFGDVIVCMRCFYVKLEFTKIEELPTKPMLNNSDSTPTSETSTESTTTTTTTRSTTIPIQVTGTSTTIPTTAITISPSIPTTLTARPTTLSTTAASTATEKPTTTDATTTTEPNTQTTGTATATTIAPLSVATNIVPIVIVHDKSAYYKQRHVIITCQFININDWSTVILTHQSNIIADIHSSAGAQSTTNENDGFKVTSTLTSTGGIVTINITEVTCLDGGKYECLIRKKDGGAVFTSGRLTVKVLPNRPVLTIPPELIAGRRIRSPLVCEAGVGSAHGILSLKIKPPYQAGFLKLPVNTQYSVDDCVVRGRVELADFTPSIQANGTVVLCEVEDRQFNISYKQRKEITVVDANICETTTNQTMVRHPYYCSHYIVCDRGIPTVQVCPRQLCFDPSTGICGHSTMLIETSTMTPSKQTAYISCRLLNFQQWTSITLEKGNATLVTVARGDRTVWGEGTLEARSVLEVRGSGKEAYLRLWVFGVGCLDGGVYVCTATGGTGSLSARDTLVVTAAASITDFSVPATLVQARPIRTNVTCSADVGYPPGDLALSLRLPNMSQPLRVEFDSREETTSGCVTTVRGEYSVSGETTVNGTVFECEVRRSDGVVVSASRVLYVVRENVCKDREGGYVPHPNDCRYFIQCSQADVYISRCSQGLCFNPRSQKCDISEPTRSSQDRTSHPCLSDRHGEYFPHPVLCNKYYWCIQGKEVIQHCRHGTVYLSNGQCTFNIAESYCYNTTLSAR